MLTYRFFFKEVIYDMGEQVNDREKSVNCRRVKPYTCFYFFLGAVTMGTNVLEFNFNRNIEKDNVNVARISSSWLVLDFVT